jgi:Mg2+ and Co2+ transporter CorA
MPNQIIGNSSNSELVQELISVLKKEASLFGTFLELLEGQQKALVNNDAAALNKITEVQREKVVESGILAERREEITRRLSSEQSLAENLTISRLIDTVSPGQATVLEQLRDTILDFHEKIGKLRSQNEMLICRSRDSIMKTMELLGRFKMRDGNYHRKGRKNSAETNVALDRRA